jgi:hypothetical protein
MKHCRVERREKGALKPVSIGECVGGFFSRFQFFCLDEQRHMLPLPVWMLRIEDIFNDLSLSLSQEFIKILRKVIVHQTGYLDKLGL